MRAMPIRAVIFDLDNTLVMEDESTLRAVSVAAAVAAGRIGIDAAALAHAAASEAERIWKASPEFRYGETFGIWWGEGLWGDFAGDAEPARAMRAFVPGFRRAVWRGALAAVGISDDALADELEQAYVAARRSGESVDADAEAVVASLARSYRLALLTNGAGDVQREKLSRTPFARSFAAIVISVEAGVGKPDPRIFATAAARLSLAPGDCVYVGDSLVRDVAGAHAAGMRAVWLDRGLWQEPEDIRPDARIERLRDLPAALGALARRRASPPATP